MSARYRYEFTEEQVASIHSGAYALCMDPKGSEQSKRVARKVYHVTCVTMRPHFLIEQPDTNGFNLARLMEVQASA